MEKEEIIKIVTDFLNRNSIYYEQETAFFTVRFKQQCELRDNTKRDVYVVGYDVGPKEWADRPTEFAYIDSNTNKIIYIITPHGYIEADGTFNDPNEWYIKHLGSSSE
ncbi:MAG: hypothetical protein SFW35_03965 [Chitinophagales bacterium]|nr:hypothetical protein [Chitinophagales bacterium]